MSRVTRVFPILCALCLTAACSSFEVRSPPYTPPSIPAEYLLPCPDPELPDQTTFSALYLNYLKNTGPWGACVRLHDQLVALVKYREQVLQSIQNQNQSPPKRWFEFWK